MTPLARITFACLVCATFAAFFVAQALKGSPPLVQHVRFSSPLLSPNGDGRHDRLYASLTLKRSDDVRATVVDSNDGRVRTLVEDRALPAGRRLFLRWDGHDDHGRTVADGTYRIRLNLRRQGRAVTLTRDIIKDTRPPRPRIRATGPQRGGGPELLPRADHQPARVHFSAPGRHTEVLVYRTDVSPVQAIFEHPKRLADDATSWTWDGTADGRRHVAAGTYVVIVRSRDAAGNLGSSTPVPPRPTALQRFPGRGGITVRYLTAQAPAGPIVAGSRTGVAVDSLGRDYRWQVRRIGSSRARERGRGRSSHVVRFQAPGGRSGLYLFEVRTRTRRVSAPLLVQARTPRPVLVVLPATTWQGDNPVDDDGDGRPDTLRIGPAIRTARPFTGDGLPPQLGHADALLLRYLDRRGHRYDLTTDVALALGNGPRLAGHRGVILAGDTRWLDSGVARALRGFVRGGGRVLSVGTGSLRRGVRITPDGRASAPTPPTTRDLFGSRLAPIRRERLTLTSTVDEIGLFAGTDGRFPGVSASEQTRSVAGGRIVAAAAADDGRRRVIVATRLGRGLVIRPGLADFSRRLRGSGVLRRFAESVWTQLALR